MQDINSQFWGKKKSELWDKMSHLPFFFFLIPWWNQKTELQDINVEFQEKKSEL